MKSQHCCFSSCINATSGCIGLADDGKDEYELVEIDLGDIKRDQQASDLELFHCLELETALKISIEEEEEPVYCKQ